MKKRKRNDNENPFEGMRAPDDLSSLSDHEPVMYELPYDKQEEFTRYFQMGLCLLDKCVRMTFDTLVKSRPMSKTGTATGIFNLGAADVIVEIRVVNGEKIATWRMDIDMMHPEVCGNAV